LLLQRTSARAAPDRRTAWGTGPGPAQAAPISKGDSVRDLRLRTHDHQQLPGLNSLPFADKDRTHFPRHNSGHIGFYFHGLDNNQNLILINSIAFSNKDLADGAVNGGSDFQRILGIGHLNDFPLNALVEVLVIDLDFPAVAVDFENDCLMTGVVNGADFNKFDDEDFAFVQIDFAGFAFTQTVKVHMAVQVVEVAVLFQGVEVFAVDFGVEGVAEGVADVGVQAVFGGEFGVDGVEIGWGQDVAGAAGDGFFAFEHDGLQVGGEAAGGLAEHAFEVVNHRVGEGEIAALFENVFRSKVVLNHEDGHVAHDFGSGGDFDDVAQHGVNGAVHFFDFIETVS